MWDSDFRLVSVVLLVIAVVSAGAVPASVAGQDAEENRSIELTTEITEDGEYDSMRLVWEMDSGYHQDIRDIVDLSGYDSVAEWAAVELVDVDENQTMEYDETVVNESTDRKRIEVEVTDPDPETAERQGMNISVTDETVSVRQAAAQPGHGSLYDAFNYTIVMPHEITESNADAVDGTAATWELHDDPPEELVVESEIESESESESDPESDTGDGDDESSDDSVPGFGVAASLLGALIVAFAIGRRS